MAIYSDSLEKRDNTGVNTRVNTELNPERNPFFTSESMPVRSTVMLLTRFACPVYSRSALVG